MGTNSVEQGKTAKLNENKHAASEQGATKSRALGKSAAEHGTTKKTATKHNAPKDSKEINEESGKRKKRYRSRKFPIPLRIVVVLILLIISGLLGLIIGYSFFGDGEPLDALKIETYQHIVDIVNKPK